MNAEPHVTQASRSKVRRYWLYGASIATTVLAIVFGRSAFAQFAEGMARKSLKQNQTHRAVVWLNRADGQNSNRPNTLFLLARVHRKLERYDQAAALLTRAESAGLAVEMADRERVLLQVQAGQIPEIEKHLAKLLADPQGEESEICEAFVQGYRAAKRFQRAAEVIDAWQADFPNASQSYYLRGVLWRDAAFLDLAEVQFRRAVELQPDHADAILALANVLRERQAFLDALATYERLLAFNPGDLRGLLGAASCLRQMGRAREARETIERVPAENNLGPDLALEHGALELATGNYPSAVSWLQSANSAAPNRIPVRRQLALALAGAGRSEDAKHHFAFLDLAHRNHNQIKELSARVFANARDTESRVKIAKLLFQLGSNEEGIRWLYGALEIEPRLASAHAELADFYERNQSGHPSYADLARRHRSILNSSQIP